MAEAPEFQVSSSPCCAAFLEAILFDFFIVDQATGFCVKYWIYWWQFKNLADFLWARLALFNQTKNSPLSAGQI
jgi:hypothetical protein